MKRILIFEDKPEYREAAKCFFETIRDEVEVDYTDTYTDALQKIADKDGALLDMYSSAAPAEAQASLSVLKNFKPSDPAFLPAFTKSLEIIAKEIDMEAPVGLLLGLEAEKKGIPFVVVSDLNHHAEKFEAIDGFRSPRQYDKNWNRRPYWRLVEGWRGKHIWSGKEPVGRKDDPERNKDNPVFWKEAFQTLSELMK